MMSPKLFVALLIVALITPTLSFSSAQGKNVDKVKNKTNYTQGELIVKLKSQKNPIDVDQNHDSWQKALRGKWQDSQSIYRKKVKIGDEENQINLLLKNPDVEYAELNYLVKDEMVPNDPYYSSAASWGQGFDDLWGVKNLGSSNAWDISQGEGVTVAVIDSGIDYTHPDLAANIWQNPGETGLDSNNQDKSTNGIDDDGNGYIDDWHGWDATTITTSNTHFSTYISGSKEMDNDPMDDNGHGTHVAGIVAAEGNNNLGVIGVAPKAKVMPVKFLTNDGSGTTLDAVTALLYAAENGAKVINNSWGGGYYSKLLADALSYIHNNYQATIVASAGNSASTNWTHAPSAYPEVISVAASTYDNSIAD